VDLPWLGTFAGIAVFKGWPMISQGEFDMFVRDYNEDYMLLLTRASKRHYDCLITSFMVLKDFYNMIQVMYDTGHYAFRAMPYPFSFRAEQVLLTELGFDDEGIANIFGFLRFVKETQGMEFEACLEAGTLAMCARVR
jgi:hypothetical protein